MSGRTENKIAARQSHRHTRGGDKKRREGQREKERRKERGRDGQQASSGSGRKLGSLAVEQHVKQLVSPRHLLYWP